MLFLANGAPQNLTKTLNSAEESTTIEISAPENLNVSVISMLLMLAWVISVGRVCLATANRRYDRSQQFARTGTTSN